MSNSRNPTIDILKGICITLVVICHYCPIPILKPMCDVIYTFHMPAFMWVSGFLYILSLRADESYLKFQVRKAQRLLLPYIIVSAVIVTIKYFSQGVMYVENPVTLKSYIRILYLPEAGYFFWYIWALVLIFLVVPLFRTRKSRITLLTVSALPYLLLHDIPQLFCLDQALRFLPYFALGMSTCDYMPLITRIFKKRHTYTFLVIAILLLAFVTAIFIYGDCRNNKLHGYAAGILGAGSLICLAYAYTRSKWLPTGLPILLANASIIIYMFHTTVQGFCKAIVHKLTDVGIQASPVVDFLVAFTLSMIVCIGLYLILQSFRMTSRLFGLKYKNHDKSRIKAANDHA